MYVCECVVYLVKDPEIQRKLTKNECKNLRNQHLKITNHRKQELQI